LRSASREKIEELLTSFGNPSLLQYWTKTRDEGEPFAILYRAIMDLVSKAPGEALRATQHIRDGIDDDLATGDRAWIQRLHANTLVLAGHAREAIPIYQDAFEAFQNVRNSREAGRVTIGWTFALAITGDPRAAKSVAAQGTRLLPTEERIGKARIAGNLAMAWHLAGNLDRAAAQYSRARAAFHRAKEPTMAAVCQHNLGLVEVLTGDFRRARSDLDSARLQFQRSGASLHELYTATGLAELNVHEGHWEAAVESINMLRERFDALGDERASAWLHRELARLFSTIGAWSAAAPEATAARRSLMRLGLEPEAAHVAYLEGRLALLSSSLVDAVARFREAKESWIRSGNIRAGRRAELEEARALLAQGRVKESLGLLKNAGRFLIRVDRFGDGALALGLRAECLLTGGRALAALPLAQEALRSARRHPAHLERPRLCLLLGRIHARRKNSSQAIRYARRAVRELESLLIRFGRRDLRILVGGSRESIYREAIDLVLDQGGAAVSIAADLLAKARSPTLIEDLLQSHSARIHPGNAAAISRLRDELLSIPQGANEEVRHRALAGRLAKLEKQLAARSRRSPQKVREAMRRRGIAGWKRFLGDRDLVLFDEGRRGWRAFVIHGDGAIEIVPLPSAQAALDDSWIPLRILLETAASLPPDRRSTFLSRTQGEADRALSCLRSALWDPLSLRSENVMIVPHLQLHGVPLEALAPQERIVARIPHPAILQKRNRSRRRKALLLHEGTPGTRREAREISAILRNHGFGVRVDDRRDALDQVTQPVGVLHVAAHGVFHREEWLRSGFRLRDGWLGFERLRARQLRGALVHFSSCESGHARLLPGSDFEGWMTAALRAGARELVLTLWKVDDHGAGSFARAFYRKWAAGSSAVSACHEAREESRAQNPHPFHWAPFIAVG
jgi:tetratricopeptide (TPR) repeat protein